MIEMVINSIRQGQMDYQQSLMDYQMVVILKEMDGERYLPIAVRHEGADSIAIKLQEVEVPRPLTHDLILSMINSLGGRVKMAAIIDLQNYTFFAELVINKANKDIRIDCCPSDAIGIAVRANAPIFAEDKVLAEAGVILPECGDIGNETQDIPREAGETKGSDKLSHLMQSILQISSEEASESGCAYIETKHVLFALSKQSQCTASIVLAKLGIDLKKLQSAIDLSIVEINDQGLSTNVKAALKIAFDEAKRFGDPFMDTDHLLIGLLLEGEGIASKTLTKLGVDIEGIYAELSSLGRFHR